MRWETDSPQEPPLITSPEDKLRQQDKELRELIKQDVDRTMQENSFFTLPEVNAQLQDMLYLWAKDNIEYGYRQGMNEVLAIVDYAFFQAL